MLSKILYLLGLIPYPLRSFIGFLAGSLYALFPSRDRLVATLQLRTSLPPEKIPPVSKVFASVGRTTMESLNLSPILKNPDKYIVCHQWDLINHWLSQKRGIVTLTAHTGNWDLLAAYMVKHSLNLTVIGKEMRNKAVQEALSEMRSRHGIETLWRADASATKQIVSRLKSAKIVAALIDQDTSVISSMVPFFGRPAKTPSALVSLAKRTNSLIVSAFLARIGNNRYEVFVEGIDSSLSDIEILSTFHSHLEKFIMRFPEQWVWFHKRWRTTVEGETLSSRNYIKTLEAINHG